MSNPVLQANIFFFITSVAVVLVALLVIVLLAYLVLILRDFKGVSRTVKEETELIAMDINEARGHLREKGREAKSMFDFFREILSGKKPRGQHRGPHK